MTAKQKQRQGDIPSSNKMCVWSAYVCFVCVCFGWVRTCDIKDRTGVTEAADQQKNKKQKEKSEANKSIQNNKNNKITKKETTRGIYHCRAKCKTNPMKFHQRVCPTCVDSKVDP